MTVESLTPITDADLLAKVKTILNITGEHFDATLTLIIEDVKIYLMGAGVSADVLGSTLAVGCIARGVSDLWNYGNGDTKLSEYFYQRADHLRGIRVGNSFFTSVSLRGAMYKNQYTIAEETDILKIGIEQYNRATDELQLFINGAKFDLTRYSVIDNETVLLKYPVTAGTKVEIAVIHLIGEA